MYEYKDFENRRFLFQDISKVFPNNPWVIKATEKMKLYSQDEYLDMVKEAYLFQYEFDKAISLGVSAKTDHGRSLFNLFIKHINWFFEIDKYAYDELIELCSPSSTQFLSVNSNYSKLLYDILVEYREELGV
jgi:hypothetical protein